MELQLLTVLMGEPNQAGQTLKIDFPFLNTSPLKLSQCETLWCTVDSVSYLLSACQ